MGRFSTLSVLVGALSLHLSLVSGAANQLQQVTANFGSNPTNVGFYIYVPTKLAAKPPILVNPHWCHGAATDAFAGSQFATLADQYGFIVIYPDSPNQADKCWDVSSPQTLSHNGGGDSLGIVSMVQYTLQKYNGDANRVFSTGVSSGAMMTNVLLGSYPDVFAAGSAFAGVAFGCFAGNGYDVWSNDCATGKIIKTGAEWAAIVKAAYPGYTGYRPKMQVFHGTADETLYPQNLQEEIKEWTAVLGLPSSPIQTVLNTPVSGWTKSVYGSTFESYSAAGVTHNIQNQEPTVMAWFDLTCTGTNCLSRTGGSTTPPPTTTPPTTTTPTSSSPPVVSTNGNSPGAPKYGQWYAQPIP
jgi:acetylxylan esterase